MAEDDTFPPMLVRMVAAGEEAGQPAVILGRYANFLQEELEHRRALQSALTYPVVLVTMSVALLVALLVFLTPVVQEMYASMDRDLPTMTRVMVDLGAVLRAWGLPAFLGLGVVGLLLWRSLPRIALDRWKLDLPLLGALVRSGLMSRWARTLGLLYGAGVPLVRALQMSREVIDNQYLNRELRGVERGDGLAVAMGRVWLVPPLLTQFLRTGERTGDLEPMLVSAAGFYERELTRRRAAMVRWLEPGLILFMGLVVGMLVVSALLPLSQLAAEL
jgi:type II secretory pathway component PulF